MVCLIHDVLVMISAYVIFQLPVIMNFIAAALTIFGYSINASIITFDRIRENQSCPVGKAMKPLWTRASARVSPGTSTPP